MRYIHRMALFNKKNTHPQEIIQMEMGNVYKLKLKWSHSVKCNENADHLHTAGWQCKWGDEIDRLFGLFLLFLVFNFRFVFRSSAIDGQGVETAFNSLNRFNLIWFDSKLITFIYSLNLLNIIKLRERESENRISDKVERLVTDIRTFTFRCGNLMCIFVFFAFVILFIESWSARMYNRSHYYSFDIIFSKSMPLWVSLSIYLSPLDIQRKIQSHLSTCIHLYDYFAA